MCQAPFSLLDGHQWAILLLLSRSFCANHPCEDDHGGKVFSTVRGTEQALNKCQLTGLLFSWAQDTIQDTHAHDLQSAKQLGVMVINPALQVRKLATWGGVFAHSSSFFFLYNRQILYFYMRNSVCSKHITHITHFSNSSLKPTIFSLYHISGNH